MITRYQQELDALAASSNLRRLPLLHHDGRYVEVNGERMLNLSGNDYLGLAGRKELREEFLTTLTPETFMPTSSSSRLLTGNYEIYKELEAELARRFHTEAALVFNSGYHANSGILSALCDAHTLILADKLVHASLIDGIRLSSAKCIRFRHNDLQQLERLLQQHAAEYDCIIVAVESVYSMDGDTADLPRLVALKQRYDHVMLYVDEAHAFGVRGTTGLGLAEEQDCIADIDLLVGTFGKAAASAGAYLVSTRLIREYLVNRMRTLIFTTALPPVCIQWTLFVLRKMEQMHAERAHLAAISQRLRDTLHQQGYECPSQSHIVPLLIGASADTILRAEQLQRHGFYALPVRPPTVPEGTSRIRFSLSATMTDEEVDALCEELKTINEKIKP